MLRVFMIFLMGATCLPSFSEEVVLTDKKGRSITVVIEGTTNDQVKVVKMPEEKEFVLKRPSLDAESLKIVAEWERLQPVVEYSRQGSNKWSDDDVHWTYTIKFKLPKGPIAIQSEWGSHIEIEFDDGGVRPSSCAIRVARDKDGDPAIFREKLMERRASEEKRMTPEELSKRADQSELVPVKAGRFHGYLLPRDKSGDLYEYWVTDGKFSLSSWLSCRNKEAPINDRNFLGILSTFEFEKVKRRRR